MRDQIQYLRGTEARSCVVHSRVVDELNEYNYERSALELAIMGEYLDAMREIQQLVADVRKRSPNSLTVLQQGSRVPICGACLGRGPDQSASHSSR